MTQVRLKPIAPQPRVNHSTTEHPVIYNIKKDLREKILCYVVHFDSGLIRYRGGLGFIC